MNKIELVKKVATKSGLSMQKTTVVIEAMLETVCELMSREEKLTLTGFGSFVVTNRRARKGHNPSTGSDMIIPAKKQVKFRPSTKIVLEECANCDGEK